MTFYFLVVGLEAKRELDQGQLRERRRLAVPVFAALGGMAVPVAIYLALNAGTDSAHGWGAAMSTDTAFALGVVALVAPRGTRLRLRLLTLAVVDDLVALIVIATVYAEEVAFVPLLVAAALFATLFALRFAPPMWRGRIAVVLGVAVWIALLESGIDPVIAGLAVGLITSSYPPARVDLERVMERTRSFREQPTPQLARSAQQAMASAISPNERLQHRLHPWTSFVIVPLFALANAGIHVDGSLLGDALASPITLGIFFGYVLGKPLGIVGATWLAYRTSRGRMPLALSWPVQRRGRDRGRDRVHRLAADREHRLRGARPRGGEGRRARDGRVLDADRVGRVPPDRAPPGPGPRAPDLGHGGGAHRPVRRPRPRARPRPRLRGGSGHADRVRRLRVPVLRAGGGGHPRAAGGLRRRPALRLAPPAAQRRASERAAGGGGRRGGVRPGRVLGDARPAAEPPGRAEPAGPGPPRRGARPRRRALLGGACSGTSTPSGSPTTWRARTPAASPARRRSSSTDGATRAPTTCRP